MTAAAGSLMKAQDHLRTMLANAAAVRTWMGVETVAAALAKIHHEALPPPADDAVEYTLAELATYRPFIIVSTDEENGYRKTAEAMGVFAAGGTLRVELEQAVPADKTNPAEIAILFKNSIGAIIDELVGMVDTAGYLAFDQIAMTLGPFRATEDEATTQGDWQAVVLELEWSGL